MTALARVPSFTISEIASRNLSEFGVALASWRKQKLALVTIAARGWLTSCAIAAASSPIVVTRVTMRKPCLRFLQRTFGSFPIFNISGRSVPFNNVPQFVAQRHSALRKPAIFSVRPPHAHVMLKRFPSGHGRAPRVHEPFTVFGMKLFRPSPTQSPLRRDACIFQPALVEEIQGTVR